jgi:hypothetical protein
VVEEGELSFQSTARRTLYEADRDAKGLEKIGRGANYGAERMKD